MSDNRTYDLQNNIKDFKDKFYFDTIFYNNNNLAFLNF